MLEKKVRMMPLDKIDIQDAFWKNYMELVRNHVIPYQWEALNDRIEGAEPSYCLANFREAARVTAAAAKKGEGPETSEGETVQYNYGIEAKGKFRGMVFQDSDVYKWLEAVAYSLMWHPDADLEKTADGAIDLIASAQQPDGYPVCGLCVRKHREGARQNPRLPRT